MQPKQSRGGQIFDCKLVRLRSFSFWPLESPSWEHAVPFVCLCPLCLPLRGSCLEASRISTAISCSEKSEKARWGAFHSRKCLVVRASSVSVEKISGDAEVKKQNFQQCLMKGLETMYRIRQRDKLQEERSRCQSRNAAETQHQTVHASKIFHVFKMSSGHPVSTDSRQQLWDTGLSFLA